MCSPFALDHYEINNENYTSTVLKARDMYGNRITAPGVDLDHHEPNQVSGNSTVSIAMHNHKIMRLI